MNDDVKKRLFIELDYIDYDALNKVIWESLNISIDFKMIFFREVAKLGDILLDVGEVYETKMDIVLDDNLIYKEMISLTGEFFKTLDSDLYYRFLNVVNEYVVNSKTHKKDYAVNFERKGSKAYCNKGRVFLSLERSIADIFKFVHEMTHKLDGAYDQNSFFRRYFGESSAITMEFLYRDFLNEKYPEYRGEVDKMLVKRLNFLYDIGFNVVMERDLLDLYEQNGKIDKQVLIDYISSLPDGSLKKSVIYLSLADFINDTIIMESFLDILDLNYLIGLFMACYFRKLIKDDEKEKSKFLKFMFLLGKSDFDTKEVLQSLRDMDFPLIGKMIGDTTSFCWADYSYDDLNMAFPKDIDSNFIKIDQRSMEKFKESFEEMLRDLGEDYVKKL